MSYNVEEHAKLHEKIVERMARLKRARSDDGLAATEGDLRQAEHDLLELMRRILDLLASARP